MKASLLTRFREMGKVLCLFWVSLLCFADDCPINFNQSINPPMAIKNSIKEVYGKSSSCEPTSHDNDHSFCNWLAGDVAVKVYGYDGFGKASPYPTSTEMIKIMRASSNGWKELAGLRTGDNAKCAQALANLKYIVLAAMPGHVCVVIPGLVEYSTASGDKGWDADAPKATCFSKNHVEATFFDEKLSKSFNPKDADVASYFFYKKD